MAAKKISPKVQQATEKYLASLGSSRDQLTEKQWQTIANYIRAQRMKVLFFLIFGIIFACVSFWAYQLGNKGATLTIPNEADEVIFVSKADAASTEPLKAEHIRNCVQRVGALQWRSGMTFTIALYFLVFTFMVPFERTQMKKTLRPFIPLKQDAATGSKGNSTFSG